MQAAVLKNDKEIIVSEVPMPTLGPGQVLIKVNWSSICGTDLHIYMGEFRDRVKYPRILGHELAGVVESVGSGAHNIKPGDRVTVDPIVWCNADLRTTSFQGPTRYLRSRIRCP